MKNQYEGVGTDFGLKCCWEIIFDFRQRHLEHKLKCFYAPVENTFTVCMLTEEKGMEMWRTSSSYDSFLLIFMSFLKIFCPTPTNDVNPTFITLHNAFHRIT